MSKDAFTVDSGGDTPQTTTSYSTAISMAVEAIKAGGATAADIYDHRMRLVRQYVLFNGHPVCQYQSY